MPSATTNRNSLFCCAAIAFSLSVFCPTVHAERTAPWVGETLDGQRCRGGRIGFGPHDYLERHRLQAELAVVENAHFTPEVERLEAGVSSTPLNDIAYTIMAWPNHHRALNSAVNYRLMNWNWPPNSRVPPAECQLQRAINFNPDDPVPYAMLGTLLHRARQYGNAIEAYRVAVRLNPNDALAHYNMGLTLVELEQYEDAMKAAKKAYDAGFPLPGLRNKLIAAGYLGSDGKPVDPPPKRKPAQADSVEANAAGGDAPIDPASLNAPGLVDFEEIDQMDAPPPEKFEEIDILSEDLDDDLPPY